jgi:hypothetical protein
MENPRTNDRLGDGIDQPTFAEQTASDADALARSIRTQLQERPGQPIALGAGEARTILRALAPLALTLGRSNVRVGKLSLEIAALLAALAACGRGTAGNPGDLGDAIAAGLALRQTIGATLDALRWRQATTAAGIAWAHPGSTRADRAIMEVLRQSTAATPERPANAVTRHRRASAPVRQQLNLLLPITGGAPFLPDRAAGAADPAKVPTKGNRDAPPLERRQNR